ncbi:hypothetical protein Vadar_030995 [Vaccinium darrowii]|uniref:Uncharacterized protein n=1 Tax=Vaccinium darrowii TaxID=229202 RepID=A0ACB7YH77_9ERIC|nr:hypothetical protein Vadar_030995 [Vaccinium darrowii]
MIVGTLGANIIGNWDVLSYVPSSNSLKDTDDGRLQEMPKQHVHGDDPSPPMDPSLNVFFTMNDLKQGKRIPIYFSTKDPSTSPHLLPKQESDSIPFSLSQLPELLEFFSFPERSPQAKAMECTLSECEVEPLMGEIKFCANSLESMLDSAKGFFGTETEFHALTTKHLSKHTALLQNYTVLEVPKVVKTPKMVACHSMPYPYAVFYCHGQEGDHKLFELSLRGDNGERVEVVGVCHVDTSHWNPDHVAFRVLHTRPGESSVCHFFPADNIIWVASPTIIKLVV